MKAAAALLALALTGAPAQASFFKSKPKPAPAPTPAAPAAPQPGPFDPLTASEIETCVSTLKASQLFSADAVFPLVLLREPGKYEPPRERQAEAFVVDTGRSEVSEAVVDLTAGKLVSWRLLPEAQPLASEAERKTAEDALAQAPAWRAALERRGLSARDVTVELLPTGAWAEAFAFLKSSGAEKASRPVSGLSAVVDQSAGKVVEVDEAPALPAAAEEPAAAPVPAPVKARKGEKAAITVAVPKPALSLEGYAASWRGWRFLLTPNPREGFVVRSVSFKINGKPHSVLYRGSLSELLNVSSQSQRGSARLGLLEGELGLGRFARPLRPGVDAPAGARYLDALASDEEGRPYAIPRAVALYEAPADDGGKELRALERFDVGARRYGLRWTFKDDGELDAAVEASAAPLAAAGEATAEQDFFSFRLDVQVDGSTSSVVEFDSVAKPSGPAVWAHVLRTEHEARRDLPGSDSRFWVIVTSGTASAYALLPGKNDVPLLPADSPARKRAGFIDHAFWVTPYRPEELYAAGEFPSLIGPVDGLERWTLRDEPVDDVDVVLWYTLGLTAPARPSDLGPVSVSSSLRLLPWAFPKP